MDIRKEIRFRDEPLASADHPCYCDACEGLGVEPATKECPCDGCHRGYHKHAPCGIYLGDTPCRTCDGTGHVTDKRRCRQCKGTGKYHDLNVKGRQQSIVRGIIIVVECETCDYKNIPGQPERLVNPV